MGSERSSATGTFTIQERVNDQWVEVSRVENRLFKVGVAEILKGGFGIGTQYPDSITVGDSGTQSSDSDTGPLGSTTASGVPVWTYDSGAVQPTIRGSVTFSASQATFTWREIVIKAGTDMVSRIAEMDYTSGDPRHFNEYAKPGDREVRVTWSFEVAI